MRIPLFIEASRLRVLVVGGGKVGTRRALKFHNAGAKVLVLAKEVSDEIKNAGIQFMETEVNEELLKDILKDFDLVVIATNSPQVNDMVYNVARKMNKLINDATDASRSDVVVPFEIEVKGMRVALTSEGVAGVAAHVAIELIKECLERSQLVDAIYSFMKEIKPWLKENVKDPRKRMPLYWNLVLRDDILKLLIEGRVSEAVSLAKQLVLQVGPEHIGEQVFEPSKSLSKLLDKVDLLSNLCSGLKRVSGST